MISADNCYLFAASKSEIRKMIADTTEELRKRGLDGKEDHMELIAWGFEGKWKSPYLLKLEWKTYTMKEVAWVL